MDHMNMEFIFCLVLSVVAVAISFYAWQNRFIYGLWFFGSGIFIAGILELIAVFMYVGWNIVTLGFSVIFLCIIIGIFSLKFVDIVPIAKNLVFESMGEGVIILDDNNRVLDINSQLENMLGIRRNKVVGFLVENISAKWLREAVRGNGVNGVGVNGVNGVAKSYSNVLEYEEAYYEVNSTPVINEGRTVGRIVILYNITSQIMAENRLKQLLQSEEKLLQTEALAHMMFNHHRAMMMISESKTGQILEANTAAESFYQLPLVGRSIYEFDELTASAEPASVTEGINHQYDKVGEYHFATRHRLGSGEIKHLWVHLTIKVVGDMELSFYILEDITEKLNLERELRDAKDKAESANQAKDNFLAIISHELRTPMNGILGMATLVLGTKLSIEQRECLELVRVSGEKLLGLLNDLLDVAKVRDGKLELEVISFSLRDMLKEFNQIMMIKARKKGLQCMFHIDYDVPENLEGDPTRLQQILINLMDNAIKFTNSGLVAATISVKKCYENKAVLQFAIRDTGIGIPQDKIEVIFHRFTQVDSSTTRKYGGTGLGLSIVKHLVERMGGAVWVESSIGKGSSFYFTVTFEISDKAVSLNTTDYIGQQRMVAHRKMIPLRVLLVEDELINQKVAIKMLKNQGHEVTLAGNGCCAVELFADGQFDIILMDIQMPEMDGIQATAAIRDLECQEAERGHVPIVAMTACAMKGDRERMLASGMDEYISKPLELDLLLSLLAKVLPHKHAEFTEVNQELLMLSERQKEKNYLDQLMGVCQGDIETVRAVISCFLDNGTQYLRNIEQAVERKDLGKLRVSAHRLKGAAAYFGNEMVVECAAQLENMGRSGQLLDMQFVVEQLQTGMKDLEFGLGKALDQLNSQQTRKA
jgi:PAS domain S-box-containing protein